MLVADWRIGWSLKEISSSHLRVERTTGLLAWHSTISHRCKNFLPKAVNTLALVSANDNVSKGCAIFKNEDSVGLAALSLATARSTTVVLEERQLNGSAETEPGYKENLP